MSNKVIHETTNYGKFHFSNQNRDVNLTKGKAKLLKKSLNQYGWIDSFPMTVHKNGKATFEILDGQHRYSIAKILGIPVKYVVVDERVNVAQINNTQDTWTLKDYLNMYVKQGISDYEILNSFISYYPEIHLSNAIGLYGNDSNKVFKEGNYKAIKPTRALRIAKAYRRIITANKDAKHRQFLKALAIADNIKEFDIDEFAKKCEKYPHLIISYSKREDFFDLFEEIYNYRRHSKKLPLAFLIKEYING